MDMTKPDKPLTPDSLGNLQLKFALAAPAKMVIRGNQNLFLAGEAHLAPGETVDMYVDTHVSGLENMATATTSTSSLPDICRFITMVRMLTGTASIKPVCPNTASM